MISGRTAHVMLRDRSARDGFGNDVEAYLPPVDVADVAVQPGACGELDATRPEGVRVALTLHFPKGWTGDLRGAKVTLDGRWAGEYRVVGIPMPYDEANCPPHVPWNMPVEVEATDG